MLGIDEIEATIAVLADADVPVVAVHVRPAVAT
jgi:hypothetical protein